MASVAKLEKLAAKLDGQLKAKAEKMLGLKEEMATLKAELKAVKAELKEARKAEKVAGKGKKTKAVAVTSDGGSDEQE